MTEDATNRAIERATDWATLLAGWTEFARSAAVLPDSDHSDRWKRSIAPAIALHAVAMALPELARIDPEERPLAMDRAELTIREQSGLLNEAWSGEPMPDALDELIADARLAWETALNEGTEWAVESERYLAPHPTGLIESLLDAGFVGEVLVPAPGVPMFKGSLAATARERDGGPVDDEIHGIITKWLKRGEGKCARDARVALPLRQVYRQLDFTRGVPSRDLIAPAMGEPPPGQPLLIPAVSGGAACPVPPPRQPLRLDPVPVVEQTPGDTPD